MTSNIFERAQQQYKGPEGAVPSGLPAAARNTEASTDLMQRARQWFTGANSTGTDNGWNTPFYQEMFRQHEAAAEGGYLRGIFDRDDYTGIVFHDTDRWELGDVIEDGQRTGNLYSAYGQEVADSVMAPFVLDPETQQQVFRGKWTAGTDALHAEIMKQANRWKEDVAKGEGQAKFQERVEDIKDKGDETYVDEALTLGGGVLGGAGAGAVIGSVVPGVGTAIGGAIGGLVGGLGSWLNRDQVQETAARAVAQTEMAAQEHGQLSAIASGMVGGGQMLLNSWDPLGNLWRGAYDWNWGQGKVGDGESRFYEVDPITGERKRSGLAEAVNIATMIPGGIGQFGSAAARRIYAVGMGSQIVGGAGGLLVSDGEKFNPYAGRFDPVLWGEGATLGTAASALGYEAINVLQLALPFGLAKMTRNAQQMAGPVQQRVAYAGAVAEKEAVANATKAGLATKDIKQAGQLAREAAERSMTAAAAVESRAATEAANVLDRLRGMTPGAGQKIVETTGRRFLLDEGRNVVKSRRTVTGVLVPSEAFQSMSASLAARRAGASATGTAINYQDDLLKASIELGLGASKRARTALVSGFAEAYEEGIQSVLEPLQFEEQVQLEDVFVSAAAGFAMGIGMSIGATRGMPRQDAQLFAQAALNREYQPGASPLTVDEWATMTAKERQTAAYMSESLKAALRGSGNVIAEENRRSVLAGATEVQWLADSNRKAEASALAKANEKTDATVVITQVSSAALKGHHVQMSLQEMQERIEMIARGAELALQSNSHPDLTDLLNQKVLWGRRMAARLERELEKFNAADNVGDRARIINGVNKQLEQWWSADPRFVASLKEAQGLSPEQLELLRLGMAQSVSMMAERPPNLGQTSTVLVLPQADLQWTAEGATKVWAVAENVLDPIGGDHDGDKLRALAREQFSPEKFAAKRGGISIEGVEAETTLVGARDYEARAVRILSDALSRDSRKTSHRIATGVKTQVRTRLRPIFGELVGFEPALASFEAALDKGDPKALTNLLAALRRDNLPTLVEMGRAGLFSPVQYINDVVNEEYQSALNELAVRVIDPKAQPEMAAKLANSTIEPVLLSSHIGQRRREASVTTGITALEELSAFTPFRMFQQLHQTADREAVRQGETTVQDPRDYLQRWFTELTENLPDPVLRMLRNKDMLTGRVAGTVFSMASELSKELSDPQAAVAMILSMRVPNVDFAGNFYPGESSISLVQSLLRESIQYERARYARTGRLPEDLESRLGALERMTRNPDSHWQAVLEAFGDYSIYTLTGIHADTMGADRTLRQLVMDYFDSGAAHRRELRDLYRADAAYGHRVETTNFPVSEEEARSGQLTAYHAMVELILTAGDKMLAEDSNHNSIGVLADTNRRTRDDLRQAIGQGQKTMQSYAGRRGIARMTLDDVRDLANENPAWFRGYLESLDGLGPAVFGYDDVDGVPVVRGADWVYKLLTLPLDQAEVMYLRETVLASYNMAGVAHLSDDGNGGQHARQLSRLRDRAHILMHNLEQADRISGDLHGTSRNAFVELLETATSVDVWEREMNKHYRKDGAPWLAFVRDRSDFDSELITSPWTQSLSGAAQRKAIAKWAQRSATLASEVETELQAEARDGAFVADVARGDKRAIKLLNVKIALAAQLPRVSGPKSWIYQSVRTAMLWYSQATDKGKAAEHVEIAGVNDASLDIFASGYVRTATSLGTYSISDIASNPALLAQGDLEIMDHDGTLIRWKALTPATIMEMWENEQTRSLVRSILSIQVTERMEDGTAAVQSLEGRSLSSIVEGGSLEKLFLPGHDNRMRYLVMVDAFAAKHGQRHFVQRIANDIVISRLSAAKKTLRPDDIEQIVQEVYQDLPDILQHMGALLHGSLGSRMPDADGNLTAPLPALRSQLMRLVRLMLVSNELDVSIETLVTEAGQESMQTALDALGVQARAEQAENPNSGAEARYDRLRNMVELLAKGDPVAVLVDQFAYDPRVNQRDRNDRKRKIYQYVRNHDIQLQNKTPWAHAALETLQSGYTRRSNIPLDPANQRGEYLPFLEEAEWEVLGRAIVALRLDALAGPSAVQDNIPEFPKEDSADRAYWDPSYSFLIDNLFTKYSTALDAVIEIHEAAGRPRMEANMVSVTNLLGRKLYNQARLGQWTPLLAETMASARQRLDSSGVTEATPASGNIPKEQEGVALSTLRTAEPVPDELVTTARLSAAVFTTTKDPYAVAVPVTPAGTTVLDPNDPPLMPLVVLNGRFARTVILAHKTDPTKNVDLLVPGNNTGVTPPDLGSRFHNLPEVAASEWRAITLNRMINSVQSSVQQRGGSIDEYDVLIEFVHPDSKPAAGYTNNVYFDGVALDSGGDEFDSLDSVKWMSGGGILPRAVESSLKSNKRGLLAWFIPESFSQEQKQRLEANWEQDLANVLRVKTIELLKKDHDGGGALHPSLYNSVHKSLALTHFVRGVNQDGAPELWEAERVIRFQQENPGQALPLADTELIKLSHEALLKAYGDTSAQAALNYARPRALESDQQFIQYRGVTPGFLQRLPGVIARTPDNTGWATRDIAETVVGARRNHSKLSFNTHLSQKTIDEMRKGIQRRNAAQTLSHTGRQETYPNSGDKGQHFANQASKVLDWAARQLRATSAAMAVNVAERAVSATNTYGTSTAGEERLLEQLAANLAANAPRTAWVLRAGAASEGVSNGELTMANLQRYGDKTPYTGVMGDVVVIDLADFEKQFPGDWIRPLEEALRILTEAHVKVVLPRPTGDPYLVARSFLLNQPYVAAQGEASTTVFEPIDLDERKTQMQRSRVSGFFDYQGISWRNRVVHFASDTMPSGKNAGFWVDPENNPLPNAAVVSDILPVYTFSNYAPPATGESIAKVRTQLQSLLADENQQVSEAGLLHLATLSGLAKTGKTGQMVLDPKKKREIKKLRADLQALLDRWQSKQGAWSMGPVLGLEWGTGHFVPMWDGRNILLYRHGHEVPDEESIRTQLATPLPGTDEIGPLAIFKPTRDPNATVHRGVVEAITRPGNGRLRVHMSIPAQTLGAKVTFAFSGLKHVLNKLDPSYLRLPERRLFGEWGVQIVTNSKEQLDKGFSEALVNNHRWAFATFGIDFTEEVTRALFPQYDSVSQDERRGLEVQAKDRLATIKQSTAPISQDRAIDLMNLVSGQALNELMSEISGLLPKGAKVEDSTPESQILRRVLVYLMLDGAELSHVLSSGGASAPGAREGTGESLLMPSIFTDSFDLLPTNDPLRKYLNKKLNAKIPQFAPDGSGYYLRPDFRFVIKAPETTSGGRVYTREHVGWLSVPELVVTAHNPELDAQAAEGQRKEQLSLHAQAVAVQSGGLANSYADDLKAARAHLAGTGLVNLGERGNLNRLLSSVPQEETRSRWGMTTPMEESYREDFARVAVEAFMQDISMSQWSDAFDSKAQLKRAKESFTSARSRLAPKLNLTSGQEHMIDWLIRMHYGIAQDPRDPDTGFVTYDTAMKAMAEIEANVMAGRLPSFNAAIPLMLEPVLAAMYRGYKQKVGTFVPWREFNRETPARDYDEWADIAFGTAEATKAPFNILFSAAADGVLHQYQRALDRFADTAISMDADVIKRLKDPQTNRLLMSLTPETRARLSAPTSLDPEQYVHEMLFGRRPIPVGDVTDPQAGSERGKHALRQQKWQKDNTAAVPNTTSFGNLANGGQNFVNRSKVTRAFFDNWSNLRVGNTMFNFALPMAQFVETTVRGSLDTWGNLLTGSSMSVAGRAASALGASYIDTDTQRAGLRLIKNLAQRDELKRDLMGDIAFQLENSEGGGWLTRKTAAYARAGAFIQNPYWSLAPEVMMRRYVESVVAYMAEHPTSTPISLDDLFNIMITDPLYVKRELRPAHDAAAATIAQVQGLKPTVLSLALRGIYEPLSKSPSMPLNLIGNVMKIQMAFSNFWFNTGTMITGTQLANAMLATYLHKRQTRVSEAIGRATATVEGRVYNPATDGSYDMSKAIDGVDLSKAFIQSGMTHTALMASALMVGASGITGEDEESRRRRKAAKYQNAAYIRDPRLIENDFRNAEAVFLDDIPFLANMYKGLDGQPAMAVPHWAIRQFTSPVLGMARFLETGDPRQILWGYQDAIGSIPLMDLDRWNESAETFAQLMSDAQDKSSRDRLEEQVDGARLILNAVGVLERQLFENTMVSQIYVAMDDYDRDPWVIPLVTGTGEIWRDKLNQPRPTTALTPYMDEDGMVRHAYESRDPMDAAVRSLVESRPFAALAAELFTGFKAQTLRTNMVPKTREVGKPELNQAEAEELVLSVFDNELGGEVLTEIGARGVLNGVWHKTAKLGDPSLEGIFIPYEMREVITEKWTEELTQEGLDMGLSEYDAGQRMKRIMYGDSQTVGLREIIWSNQISYSPTNRYYQLNTTYVIGPDGMPWATGVNRTSLYSMFGMNPLMPYESGQKGLPGDERLNAVDATAGINTGLRSLQKVDESWEIPTDEEIAETLAKAIEKALSKSYKPSDGWEDWGSGWRNYGRSYGYGGYSSGGGGGSFTRLQTPVRNDVPYGNNIPFLNTSNPIIRRATVRRERFSSTRGRLNQWQ